MSPPPVAVDVPGAQTLVADLCRPFCRGAFSPDCTVVQPADMPYPEDDLLVHHDHMTVVLQRFHGSPVQVNVLEEKLEGDLYMRKISLSPVGSDKVVEWGVVRLNFKYMPKVVQQEILAKQMPLGAILIKHKVHRRIKPRYFLRVPPGSALAGLFDASNPEALYGRLGMIYCDDEPCIEVLEIVLNTR